MEKLEDFCRAFQENDTMAIEEGFNSYLKKTISIRDTNTKKGMKEPACAYEHNSGSF